MTDISGERRVGGPESGWSDEFLAGFNLRRAYGNCPPDQAVFVFLADAEHGAKFPEFGRFTATVGNESSLHVHEGIFSIVSRKSFGLRPDCAMMTWEKPEIYAQAVLLANQATRIFLEMAEAGGTERGRLLFAQFMDVNLRLNNEVQPLRDDALVAKVFELAALTQSGGITAPVFFFAHPGHLTPAVVDRFGDVPFTVLAPIHVPPSEVAPQERYALTHAQRTVFEEIANGRQIDAALIAQVEAYSL